jgi:hypothetical protein
VKLTLYPNLWKGQLAYEPPQSHRHFYIPIPITGPYLFSSTSAFAETGHKRRMAKRAKKKTDSEDARRRDCALVGRRDNRDMVEKREERKRSVLVQRQARRVIYERTARLSATSAGPRCTAQIRKRDQLVIGVSISHCHVGCFIIV